MFIILNGPYHKMSNTEIVVFDMYRHLKNMCILKLVHPIEYRVLAVKTLRQIHCMAYNIVSIVYATLKCRFTTNEPIKGVIRRVQIIK